MVRRYKLLSDEADAAIDQLAADNESAFDRPEVARLERARERLSARVVRMPDATGDAFRALQADANQISGQFERAIDDLHQLGARNRTMDPARAD